MGEHVRYSVYYFMLVSPPCTGESLPSLSLSLQGRLLVDILVDLCSDKSCY